MPSKAMNRRQICTLSDALNLIKITFSHWFTMGILSLIKSTMKEQWSTLIEHMKLIAKTHRQNSCWLHVVRRLAKRQILEKRFLMNWSRRIKWIIEHTVFLAWSFIKKIMMLKKQQIAFQKVSILILDTCQV